MKKTFVFIMCFSFWFKLSAQTDSIKYNINKITRQSNLLSVGYYWSTPHTLKNSDALILDGIELNDNQGYYINGKLPIYVPKKGHIRFVADYGYLSTTFENSNTKLNDTTYKDLEDKRYKTHRYTISPTAIVNYKLGNRTVVHMLKVSLNSYDFFDPSYYSVLFTTNIMLKRTPKKSSMIGLAIIHANNMELSVIPFPIYSYNTYLNPKWTFEMTLPYSIGIRRVQSEKFTIKSDLKLDVFSSMFRPQYYNDVTRFSDMGLAASVDVNYKLFKYVMWKTNLSYKYSFGPKVIDVNTGDDLYEFDPTSKLMINAGLSFSF